MVVKWRSPADRVAGLGGLTVQALCLSGYSHYPPPQSPAQLSLHQGGILWLTLEMGMGLGFVKMYSTKLWKACLLPSYNSKPRY